MITGMPRATSADAPLVIVTGVLFLAWALFAYRRGWSSVPACIGFAVAGGAALISGITLSI